MEQGRSERYAPVPHLLHHAISLQAGGPRKPITFVKRISDCTGWLHWSGAALCAMIHVDLSTVFGPPFHRFQPEIN